MKFSNREGRLSVPSGIKLRGFESLLIRATVTALFCVTLTLTNFAEGTCPEVVFIEKNNSSKISCVTQDKVIEEAFWYKGSISHTSPILRLENGNSSGTGHDNGEYVIDSEGAMTIYNASIKHEADYFFVAFFKDGTFEEGNVTIILTVTPVPPCPKVADCMSCEDCYSKGRTNGKLTCSLIAVRPMMRLNWIIENKSEIDISLDPLTIKNNSNGYTWDVIMGLSYATKICGHFILRCVAQDDQNMLEYSTAVHLQTDNCSQVSHRNSRSVLLFIIVVAIVIAGAVVAFVIYCNVVHKGHKSVPTAVDPEEEPLTFTKSTYLDPTAQEIADYLKKAYEPLCSMHVLPWVDSIPITCLDIDRQLTLKNVQGSTTKFSCSKIFQNISFNDTHRAMIIADRGYGKTHVTKNIIHQWSQEKANSFVLIYVDGEDISQNMDVIDTIVKLLPKSYHSSKEKIHQAVQSSEKKKTKRQSDLDTVRTDYMSNCNGRLFIEDIFEGNLNEEETNINIHLWVTSSRQYTPCSFKFPHAEIRLSTFSEQQQNAYIEKTCFFYIFSHKSLATGTNEGLTPSGNFNRDSSSDHFDPRENFHSEPSTENTPNQEKGLKPEEVISNVLEIFKRNNVLQDFQHNLSFFVLLVHIVTAKLTIGPSHLHGLNVKSMASLIAATVNILILSYKGKCMDTLKELKKIKATLEAIAFNMTIRDNTFKVKFPEDSEIIVTIAKKVGILREKDIDGSIQINFSHPRMEEYFAAKYISKLDEEERGRILETIGANHTGFWEFMLYLQNVT